MGHHCSRPCAEPGALLVIRQTLPSALRVSGAGPRLEKRACLAPPRLALEQALRCVELPWGSTELNAEGQPRRSRGRARARRAGGGAAGPQAALQDVAEHLLPARLGGPGRGRVRAGVPRAPRGREPAAAGPGGSAAACSSAALAAAWGFTACPGSVWRAARLRTCAVCGRIPHSARHARSSSGRATSAGARTSQVHSYVSHVRFMEACAAVPADALLLEVGPHALLRSPLRQNRATLPCARPPWPVDGQCCALPALVHLCNAQDSTQAAAYSWSRSRAGSQVRWQYNLLDLNSYQLRHSGARQTTRYQQCGVAHMRTDQPAGKGGRGWHCRDLAHHRRCAADCRDLDAPCLAGRCSRSARARRYASLMKKGAEAGATLRDGAGDLWRKGAALTWRAPAGAAAAGARSGGPARVRAASGLPAGACGSAGSTCVSAGSIPPATTLARVIFVRSRSAGSMLPRGTLLARRSGALTSETMSVTHGRRACGAGTARAA